MSDCLRLDNLSSSDQKYPTSSNIRIFIFATLNFCRCMLHVPGYQYYKGRVACDLCVTRKYCVPSNPRRQSTSPSRFFRVWSTCRCITCLALYELWTKFWNVTHLKIILFSPMSSLAPACIHKHEIIHFHNTLMINLLITYIFLPCLCLISLFLFNLSKSRLFTSHIYFQFRVQDHIAFKLMHRTRTTSDLDVLYMYEKIKR
jgi:hypothetical protein